MGPRQELAVLPVLQEFQAQPNEVEQVQQEVVLQCMHRPNSGQHSIHLNTRGDYQHITYLLYLS